MQEVKLHPDEKDLVNAKVFAQQVTGKAEYWGKFVIQKVKFVVV